MRNADLVVAQRDHLQRLLDEAHEDNRKILANAKYDRDQYKAHAERLAKALRDASTWFSAIKTDEHDGANLPNMIKQAREALAQWEAAQ